MKTSTQQRAARKPAAARKALPAQTVLVLQGGGALGAYQVGVYQAMHEAGIEPDWVIGTSIGAINAALIAGNRPEDRLARLHGFWDEVQQQVPTESLLAWLGMGNLLANMTTVTRGIPAFFSPNPAVLRGTQARVGVESASYYSTAPLRETLASLVDYEYLCNCETRLTVGAVNVRTGQMRYFDTRDEKLGPEHVMASGALPPAFPAVRIGNEAYWDGGIYSNTPIEAVLDDKPRRSSVIFAVNVWQPDGPEPESIWQVMGRQKDIQYASRADSHIKRQKQIHRLRHVIRELTLQIPQAKRTSAQVRELAAFGCGTTMHIVRLLAPRLDGEDHTKDIDFSVGAIHSRWEAGYVDTRRAIERAPWEAPVDPMEGVIEHIVLHDPP